MKYLNSLRPSKLLAQFLSVEQPNVVALGMVWPAYLMFGIGLLFGCWLNFTSFEGGLFSGQMWAESATLYHQNASGSLEQFLVKDAGYFVFPQQLIAFLGYYLGVSAKNIPYFYNGVATLLSAAMVSLFCLPRFRCIINSDITRLILCVALFCVGDFETRNYISFTYYSAIYVLVIVTLALVDKQRALPWYAWFMPLFFLAKPAIIALTPALFLGFVASRRSAKVLFLLSLVCVVVQLINSVFYIQNFEAGVSLGERVLVFGEAMERVFGTFFSYESRPFLSGVFGAFLLIVSFVGSFFACLRWRGAEKLLFIQGILLIVGANLIVSFGLKGDQFDHWVSASKGFPVFRWTVIQVFGILFVGASVFYALARRVLPRAPGVLFILFFFSWIYFSGWTVPALNALNFRWSMQIVGWQDSGPLVDSKANVCVMIEPLGWIYSPIGSTCRSFSRLGFPDARRELKAGEVASVSLIKESVVISSIAIPYLVTDVPSQEHSIELNLNGDVLRKEIIPNHSGVIHFVVQFQLEDPVKVVDIESIMFSSSIPVRVGVEANDEVLAYWYGDSFDE